MRKFLVVLLLIAAVFTGYHLWVGAADGDRTAKFTAATVIQVESSSEDGADRSVGAVVVRASQSNDESQNPVSKKGATSPFSITSPNHDEPTQRSGTSTPAVKPVKDVRAQASKTIVVPKEGYPVEDAMKYYVPKSERRAGNLGGPPPPVYMVPENAEGVRSVESLLPPSSPGQ